MPTYPDSTPTPSFLPEPVPPPGWRWCLTIAAVTGALVGGTVCVLAGWAHTATSTPDPWDDLIADLFAFALGAVVVPVISLVGLKVSRLRYWAGSALIGLGLSLWFMSVLDDATHATGLGSLGWRWLVAVPAFLLPAAVLTAWETARDPKASRRSRAHRRRG